MIYNYLIIFLLLSFYEWLIKLFCIVDYIHGPQGQHQLGFIRWVFQSCIKIRYYYYYYYYYVVRQVLCPLQSLKWIICYQTLWLTRFIIFPTFPGHFFFYWLPIKKLVSDKGEKITLSHYMSIRVIIISEEKFSVIKFP